MGDTSTVDRSIGGVDTTSSSAELSLKTMLSWKRARVEEGIDLVL